MTEGTEVHLVDNEHALLPSTATEEHKAIIHSDRMARGPGVLFEGADALMFREQLAQGGYGRIIDNFERGNLHPYSGRLEDAVVQRDVVQSGSRSLRIDSTHQGCSGIYSLPGDGLPNYPGEGDITEYFMRPADYGSAGFYIGLTPDLDGYRVSFTDRDDGLTLAIYEVERDGEDGLWNISRLSEGEVFDVPLNQFYKIQTEIHPDKIVNRAFIQEGGSGPFDVMLDETQAAIPGLDGRGVGFGQFYDGSTSFYDNARIVGTV